MNVKCVSVDAAVCFYIYWLCDCFVLRIVTDYAAKVEPKQRWTKGQSLNSLCL